MRVWSWLLERDRLRLEDIREYAGELLSYTRDVGKEAFLADRKLQLVAERLLEIIGEAAGGLSSQARDGIDVDWRGIRGLRNILAHQYGHVDRQRLYRVVSSRVAPLLEAVEAALVPPGPTN